MNKKALLIVPVIIAVAVFLFLQFYSGESKIAEHKDTQQINLTFLRVVGKVSVEKDGKSEEAKEGATIDKFATVKTEAGSVAIIAYGKDYASKIKLGEKTSLDISKVELNLPEQKEGIFIQLLAGDILLKIFNPSKQKTLRIKTKTVTMGIRGTTFFVRANENDSVLLVKEGAVEMESDEKRNTAFVYTDKGFVIDSNGEAKPVDLNTYNVNWDVEKAEIEKKEVVKIDYGVKLAGLINDMKEEITVMQSKIKGRKIAMADQESSNEAEFLALKNDNFCIDNNLKNCRLESKLFEHDILYNREDQKSFFTEKIKISLKEDIEKYKTKLIGKVSTLKSQIHQMEIDLPELENKHKLAHAKLSELDSMDAAKKESSKKDIYKAVIEILDDAGLRNEFAEQEQQEQQG